MAGALLIFALAHARFRQSPGQIAAGVAIGLLIGAGWFATGWLGADDFNPAPVASLTFIAPLADTLQYVMLSTGLPLSFGIALATGTLAGQLPHRAGHAPLPLGRLHVARPHAALRQRRGADGNGRRHGLRLLDRTGTDRRLHPGPAVVRRASPES